MTSMFTRKSRHFRHEPIMATDEMQSIIDTQAEEITALQNQLQTLKDLYQGSKDQKDPAAAPSAQRNAEQPGDSATAAYQKQRIEKLMSVVAEREKQMRDLQNQLQTMAASHQEVLQNERKEKHTLLSELEALQTQLSGLKTKFVDGQRRQQTQEAEITALRKEKDETAVKLLEAARIAEHKDYLESECERMGQIQIDLTLRLEEATARVKALEESLKSKEETLQVKETQACNLQSVLEETERKAQALQNERNMLQENIFRTQSAQEDAEARLKVAHFHLAKKVKETAQLNDRNEEIETQLREYTTDLNESQGKIQELQKLLEEQFLHERKRQEQLQESLKETEALAAAWEEKYFKITEKWQEYELRFNEMKKLEEKLQKVQSQWINMGFLFEGLDRPAPPMRAEIVEEKRKAPVVEPERQEKSDLLNPESIHCNLKQSHQTLFETPQPSKLFQQHRLE